MNPTGPQRRPQFPRGHEIPFRRRIMAQVYLILAMRHPSMATLQGAFPRQQMGRSVLQLVTTAHPFPARFEFLKFG